MTVHLLTSAQKPLLDLMRQRLSSFDAHETPVVLVPVANERAEDLASALGLTPEAMGFASMQGLHRLSCSRERGRAVLVLLRAATTAAALKEVMSAPDVLISNPEDVNGRLRALIRQGTTLVTTAPLGKPPRFLRPLVDGWRLMDESDEVVRTAPSGDVLIVGAGLAGAMTAWEVARRGLRPVVVDAGLVPGSGASALYAGLIHPHWQASDSPLFQLTRAGFEAMTALLEDFPDTFHAQGVVDVASSDEEYEKWREAVLANRPIALPNDFASLMTREEASEKTGLELARGGWLYPKSGLVHAGRLVRRLLEASRARVLTNVAVRLERRHGEWAAVASGVVLATAPRAVASAALATPSVLGLTETHMGLNPLYGRITLLRETDLPTLKCALTGDGYVAKLDGFCAVGATYEPGLVRRLTVEEAHEHNLSTFEKLAGARPDVLEGGFYEGVRAVPADRMPLAGRGFTSAELSGLTFKGVPEVSAIPRAEGLWICAGFGSRGLTWGLSCAQHVAADICGDVQALPKSLATKLDPARFLPKLLAGR